jgi:hypothetical protein
MKEQPPVVERETFGEFAATRTYTPDPPNSPSVVFVSLVRRGERVAEAQVKFDGTAQVTLLAADDGEDMQTVAGAIAKAIMWASGLIRTDASPPPQSPSARVSKIDTSGHDDLMAGRIDGIAIGLRIAAGQDIETACAGLVPVVLMAELRKALTG